MIFFTKTSLHALCWAFLGLLGLSQLSACGRATEVKAINGFQIDQQNDPPTSRHNYRIFSPKLPSKLDFAGEDLPLQMFYVVESLQRELLVNAYWHSSTLMTLQRTGRWFPVIEPILKENGIPDDFKYLCAIESNLTNTRSPAGAAGFWQFMEGTAKEYQLEVNADVDERYHLEKSTKAACQYLRKAFERYQSWALVAAAYNAGTKRIDGFLSEQKAGSYFDLLMAEETERYLYRIMAMKIIAQDPGAFGYEIRENDYYQPLQFEEVSVNQPIIDLAAFAASKGFSYKLLKIFNPWLRSNKLQAGLGKSYILKLPISPYNLTHKSYGESAQ